jgi:hypothetical protein
MFAVFAGASIYCHSDYDPYQVKKVPYSSYLEPGKLTVVASFDGSKALDRWPDILSFAKENKAKFTFFISGVYFIANADKDRYIYPVNPAQTGRSDIGFGGASTDVVKRIDFINEAIKNGHDIETHLNGHFDGTRWTESMWRLEFSQFNEICSFLPKPVHHVRFPLLAMDHKVFPVLAENNIYSITSVVERDFENFSRITINSNGKPYTFIEFPISFEHENRSPLILMDYNFYLYDQIHHIDMAKAEQDMVILYMEEAEKCFREKRPFFISHHFSNWNHAAYWNAMKKVIEAVNTKYQVKYLTISELYDVLAK